MESKGRIHYIDIAKGFAMILVILGHIKKLPPGRIVWWLYTFHMPLFFILSGMVFSTKKYKTFKEFFIAKFKSLIIPYICLSLIAWFWIMIVRNPTNFIRMKTLDNLIGIFLSDRGDRYYFAMWFLTALFSSEVVLYLIEKTIKKKSLFFPITFVVSAVIGSIIITKRNSGFYWSLDLVPTAISFIVIGYGIRYYKDKIKINIPTSIALAVILILTNILIGYINHLYNGRSDLYELNIGNPSYYYISAISGSLGTILVCKLLKRSALLEYIGRNSIIYYAFNKMLFIDPLLVITNTLAKLGGVFENRYIKLLIVMTGTCIGLAIISEIIKKCFPFILGRSRLLNKTINNENNVEKI